jgi:ABC-type phosphate transport system auxiliary subunit
VNRIQARDSYQAQVEFSTVEIEKKNKDLLAKICELDAITRRYEGVLQNMQGRADEVLFP